MFPLVFLCLCFLFKIKLLHLFMFLMLLNCSAKTSVDKDDSICIIPECTREKFIDRVTKQESEFCSKGHAAQGQTLGLCKWTDIII